MVYAVGARDIARARRRAADGFVTHKLRIEGTREDLL